MFVWVVFIFLMLVTLTHVLNGWHKNVFYRNWRFQSRRTSEHAGRWRVVFVVALFVFCLFYFELLSVLFLFWSAPCRFYCLLFFWFVMFFQVHVDSNKILSLWWKFEVERSVFAAEINADFTPTVIWCWAAGDAVFNTNHDDQSDQIQVFLCFGFYFLLFSVSSLDFWFVPAVVGGSW